MKYDFSGYATKNGLKCSDGRIIQKDAFKHQDGIIVPLVWQHLHDDPKNVLGHAKLENREDGVYCYATFNDSENGKNAKELVKHGDVSYLSIYANKLKQKGASVLHGAIREVSLVLSGANPGAVIENISFAHADGSYVEDDTEVIITTGIELTHGDETLEDVTGADDNKDPSTTLSMSDIYESMNDDQKALFKAILDQQDVSLDSLTHGAGKGGKEKSVKDIFETFSDEQKDVVYFLIENALGTGNSTTKKDGAVKHYDEGDNNMKHNVFDTSDVKTNKQVSLTHDQMTSIITSARKYGSLKDSFLAHAEEYGFDPINILFPDARLVNAGEGPTLIKREDAWVSTLLGEATHSPFSRIKTVFADITADEARAKGYYTPGTEKVDEVIALMKRITTPTTIYKKQKLDRDDLIDITDFEVISWLKREMRGMLNEELARAILVGDGRGIAEADKINEGNIRPIFMDAPLYATRVVLEPEATVAEIIDSFIRARKDYKGSGTPSLYVSTDLLTDMLLLKDSLGRRLYDNEQDLASVLRVSKIVEVELLNNIKRIVVDGGGTEPDLTNDLLGIVVNMKDYVIGADKGGEISMFDDFDIDFNQYKYLIETRVSGALVRPKSALIVERPSVPEPDEP